jgi:pilus assembly protein CpaE
MPGPSNLTRVVLLCEPGPIQEQVTTALSAQNEFLLADAIANMERLARDLRAAEPDIILVDHRIGGQPTLDIIDDLALQFPEAPVVAILPGEDPLAAQQVIMAGARAFLVQPFTQVNLLSTLRRVRDLESRRRPVIASSTMAPVADEDKPVKTIAVYSPRGGAGTSTLALNLALALHDETDGRVLLVEGKLAFGHLDVLLNLRTRNTLADLIPHANALDSGLVAEVVVEHATGLQVILGPNDLQVAQGIRAEDLFNVVEGLKRLYDFLVIDIGSTLNENTVTLMDAADRVLRVTTPELAALHDVSRFVGVSRSLGYPPGKLLVVLNRAGLEGGVKTKDIESALHHELFGQVPEDGANALRSLNRGLPLIVRYPRSPASKAYVLLARQLTGMGANAPARTSVPAKDGKGKEKPRRAPKRAATKA